MAVAGMRLYAGDVRAEHIRVGGPKHIRVGRRKPSPAGEVPPDRRRPAKHRRIADVR